MGCGDPGHGAGPAGTVVLLLLVLAGLTAAGLVTAAGADGSVTVHTSTGHSSVAQTDDPSIATLQDQPEADATVTRIVLDANGSATWTIEVRTRLASADDAAEYEAFQERFRSNRTRYLADFESRMTGVVESANASIDRPMVAEAFRASTRIEEAPQRWGVVTYSFRWEGFAATGGDRVIAGDVFGGDFFIEENSVLEVVLPDGHAVETAAPPPDSRSASSIQWEGPATIGDGRPRIVATSGDGDDGLPPWGIAVGIAVLTALLALAVAWRRGSLAGSTADARTGGGPEEETGTGEGALAEREPLTDEDRVRELLAANGGRCKQSRIVEELEWSKSKTSRVLTRMAEDDRVEKLRIGRENVIELVDEE